MKRVFTKLASVALAAVMTFSCVPCTDFGFIAPQIVEAASQIGITESSGWTESAWVEWKPSSTSGVSYYKVSYSGTASGTVDNNLIRLYKDGHWRADLVGLKAGSYTVKVEACSSSGSAVASETASVTVTAHDRTGFTFSPKSTFYDSSDPLQCGGYNGDGTPKSGAEILYITKASDIDTVTDSTGTTGLSTILQGRNKRTTTPLIVRIIGKIDYSGSELNSSGYIQVKPSTAYTNYNTTIEGIGQDTTVNFGFLLRNAGNVEIRNIAVHDFADDGISLDTDNCNVWLHNNEFFYGVQGSGDKAKGDGSSDVKNDSQYVTLSYNHYWDAGKCSLCGMTSETGDNYISYHHNWFDHSDSRHPRIRTMFVHVYNNYYDGNAKYGVGLSANSNAFVEGNYFRNCKHPTLQGSVGYDNDGSGGSNTFDDSPPIGAAKLWNNTIEGSNVQFTAGSNGETAADNDGCVATSRSQVISYTTAAGATYSNYDTSSAYIQSLASKIQEPADAKTTVVKYAGRTGGGDFAEASGFAFTSADDTDYAINTTLRTDLTNYCADSVSSNYAISSVGGSVDGSFVPEETQSTTKSEATTETTTKTVEGSTETTTQAQDVPAGGVSHNFTLNGTTSTFYTITGSLSTSKGTVSYNGLSLTQCLKMESATSITFTASAAGKLTLVFGGTTDAAGKTVKVDGNSYTADSNGIATIDVAAGSHTITKGDAINLFYMNFASESTTESTTKETTTETTTTTTTTESTTETTTQSSSDTGTVQVNPSATGYSFTTATAGKLTTDSTYGGASSNYNSSTNYVEIGSNGAYLYDSSATDTTNGTTGVATTLTMPLAQTYTSGKLTVSGTVTPSASSSKWAYIDIQGVNGSVVKIGTDDSKNLAISTTTNADGTNAYVSSSVLSAADTAYTYNAVLDLDAKSVTVTIGGATLTTSLVNTSVDKLVATTSASAARNLTVGNITVAYEASTTTTVVKGDSDGDGDVDKDDVTNILAYVVGKASTVADAADVDGDGEVTVADAYKISQKVLGIISSL